MIFVMKQIIVADLMTRNPIIIDPKTNLLECTKHILNKKISTLLLVQNKKLVGVISGKDILWAMMKKSKDELKNIPAINISPKKLATIKPSATIKETIEKMKNTKFSKLPVISKKELVGLITSKDIVTFNPEILPELDELSEIRERTKKLERIKQAEKRKSFYEGICEECGNSDFLYKFNGILLCENCMNN